MEEREMERDMGKYGERLRERGGAKMKRDGEETRNWEKDG